MSPQYIRCPAFNKSADKDSSVPKCEILWSGNAIGDQGDCAACILRKTLEQRRKEGKLMPSEQKAEDKKALRERFRKDVRQKKDDVWGNG
jgi:hypothetical protein